MENYEVYTILGKGTYAVVYGGMRKTDGKHFALKVFNLNTPSNIVRNEVQVMRHLMTFKIDNVVEIEEIFMNDNKQYVIVMEKLGGGELFDRIIERGSFSESDAAKCMKTFITALNKLHTEVGLIHRDLKPENIVYIDRTKDSDIKIVDFGLSVICNPQYAASGVICKDMVGTIGYMAPESIQRLCYSAESDIWSAGVILYCVLTGIPPFNSEDKHISHRIVHGEYYPMNTTYWDGISESAKDLVRQMLTVDPNKRITANGILNHPWITHYTTITVQEDLGSQYVKRIAQLSSRQKFRKVVNGIIWANRLRKGHLAAILFPSTQPAASTEATTGHGVTASAPTTPRDTAQSTTPDTAAIHKSKSVLPLKPSQVEASLNTKELFTDEQLSALRKKFIDVARQPSKVENGSASRLSSLPSTRRSSRAVGSLVDGNEEFNDGIGYDQFCKIVESVGLQILAKPHVFRLFDNDGNGVVDYKEFLMALTTFRGGTSTDGVRLCFDIFDSDGSGEISLQELKAVMASVMSDADEEAMALLKQNSQVQPLDSEGIRPPMKVKDDHLEALFQAIDTNGDGVLSFEEFSAWVGSDVSTLHAIFIDPMTKALTT